MSQAQGFLLRLRRLSVRGSPKPNIKWYFWKVWVGLSIYLYTPDALDLGLPINEGYFVLLEQCLWLVWFSILLSWLIKPTIWLSFNLTKGTELVEVGLRWLVIVGVGGYGILGNALPSLIGNILEPKQTIALYDYYTHRKRDCSDKCDGLTGFKYYLHIDKINNPNSRRVLINKASFDWLKENEGYEMISTSDGSVTTIHAGKPVLLTYKPKAEIAFNIETIDRAVK